MNFAANIKKFQGMTEEKLDKVVRKTALDVYKGILELSPVDTGRFRSNNILSIDAIDKSENGIKSESAQLLEANTKLSGKVAGHTVFIQNNLDYATALEYGRSKQAPRGVYGVTLLRFGSILKNNAKGK